MNTYYMTLLFTALVAGASVSKPAISNVSDYSDEYVSQQYHTPEVAETYVPEVVGSYVPKVFDEAYPPEVVEPNQPEHLSDGDSYENDSYAPDGKNNCGRGHLHKHKSGKTHCHHHRHHHGRKW